MMQANTELVGTEYRYTSNWTRSAPHVAPAAGDTHLALQNTLQAPLQQRHRRCKPEKSTKRLVPIMKSFHGRRVL